MPEAAHQREHSGRGKEHGIGLTGRRSLRGHGDRKIRPTPGEREHPSARGAQQDPGRIAPPKDAADPTDLPSVRTRFRDYP